jgi:hypothetical protein
MTTLPLQRDFRVAALAAYAGAVASGVGVIFLLLLYIGLLAHVQVLVIFGPLNDVCVLVQYALGVPVAIAFHRILRRHSRWHSLSLLILGLAGMIGIALLQALLLVGAISFRIQLPLATAAVFTVGAWVLGVSLWARRVAALPARTGLLVAAALYFGYPIWAYRVAQHLRARGAGVDVAA